MSHRKGRRRRREEAEAYDILSDGFAQRYQEDVQRHFDAAFKGKEQAHRAREHRDDSGRRWYWFGEAGMPPPRRDYYETRAWKSRPVPAGEQPFRVNPVDGVVDLHPSQWSVR